MEQPFITSVTYSTSDSRITLFGIPDQIGAAALIFQALADNKINIDMIMQNEPVAALGRAEISLTMPRDELKTAKNALQPLEGKAYTDAVFSEAMGKVSLIGAGLRSHPEVSAKVFSVLAEEKINMDMISTSPIQVGCVIPSEDVPRAVKALSEAFGLDPDEAQEENPFR